MTAAARHLLAALALVFAPACVLDLGGADDDSGVCKAAAVPVNTTRVDPSDLVCKDATVTCTDCGCLGGDPPADGSATWAPCQSQCTGLASNVCMATEGCRAAWDFACMFTDQICTLPDNGYYGCFAVDATGPVHGACDGLAAQDCSAHDDCMGVYRRDERCGNQLDDDQDGNIDEPDECLAYAQCVAKFR